MGRFVVGIDIGGTNIKFGLVSASGRISAQTNLKTATFIRSKTKLINAVHEQCLSLIRSRGLKKKDISGVGIGLPGLVNTKSGIVHFLPNIPGWRDVPLVKILTKKLKLPVVIDNDVNVITLAEWKFGAGKGINNLVCITLGTGVGGGLILDGQMYRGAGSAAGEIGHTPINEKGPRCNCGGWGCLESYVGNRPLGRRSARLFKNRNVTLEEMNRLASAGNKRAIRFWEETAVQIGNGLVGVVNLLNPQMIVIGGGVSSAHRHLFKGIRRTIAKRAMRVQGSMVKVVRAKLGNKAGILGTQVLVNL